MNSVYRIYFLLHMVMAGSGTQYISMSINAIQYQETQRRAEGQKYTETQ